MAGNFLGHADEVQQQRDEPSFLKEKEISTGLILSEEEDDKSDDTYMSFEEDQMVELLEMMPSNTSDVEVTTTIPELAFPKPGVFTRTFFGEPRIYGEVKDRDFQTFFNILALLLTNDVKEGLKSFFDIPELHTGGKLSGDNVAVCNVLKEKGIINPLNTNLLTTALTKCGQRSVVAIVNTVFTLFILGELETSTNMKKEKERQFQIFLDILSLLMTKRVKEGLELFFDIPEIKGRGRFKDDNLAFCNLLYQKGVISPLHIDILTATLNECGLQSVVKFADLLFLLFKFGDLDTSDTVEDEKEGDYQSFLAMLSLLITNEVREGLKSFFDIPEAQNSVVNSGNEALCKVLQEKGIINPLHLELLAAALEECGQQSVKKIADTLFELFKFGKLGTPTVLEVETELHDFQGFLDIFSLLMTDEVKEGLASFFDIPEAKPHGKPISDNVAYCNLLKEKGIISSTHFDLFITTMLECGQRSVAKISHTLFSLLKEGKLGTSSLLKEEKEREFKIFLDVLSLPMTKEVKEGLKSFFDIPEIQDGGIYEDNNVAFCNLLRDKGIISPVYNELLTIALVECGQEGVATFSDTLCQLFKEGRLGALITPEEEKDFQQFLEYLSSVMTVGVKSAIASFFKFPASEIDKIFYDNITVCNYLKEKHIISGKYISPLIHGLNVVKTDPKMCKLFNEETSGNLSLLEFKEELEAFIQEISDHFTMFTSSTKIRYLPKRSPWTVSKNSISETSCDVQSPPNEQHPKDTEMIKPGQNERRQQQLERHNNIMQASLCTSAELSLDFGQHQTFNNVETDDTSHDESQFFSRAGGTHCLEATSSISKEGGNIEIPYTGVELQIRPNSFLREDEVHLITVKILPRRLFDEAASCFEDHSTVMVEIFPNNLKLQRAAKLTLPHCLIMRDPKNCEVKIFHSHHDPDQLPQWEDISKSVQHELSTKVCHIWIKNFSWIKYTVDGKTIEGKKLFLYTLGKRYTLNSKFITAEVGYFPALPGNERQKLEDADFVTSKKGTSFESKLRQMFQGSWQTFVFWKEPKTSLAISVLEINPSDCWKSASTCPKYISYQHVEISNEQCRPFTFRRQNDETPFPAIHFKVCQGEEYSELYVNMEEGLVQDELQVSNDQQQTRNEKQHIQPMIEGNEEYSTTFGDEAVNLSNVTSPVNNEARKIRETALVLSSNSGGIIVTDQRREEITFQRQIQPGSMQEINHNFGELHLLPHSAPYLQMNSSTKLMPVFSKLSTKDVINLARVLDIPHPLMRDWRMLAGNLGFKDMDVDYLALQNSPTRAVIHCACQSGALRSKDHLIETLKGMERIDAKNAIL